MEDFPYVVLSNLVLISSRSGNASCCVIPYNFYAWFPSEHNSYQNLIHISLCIMSLLGLIVSQFWLIKPSSGSRQQTLSNYWIALYVWIHILQYNNYYYITWLSNQLIYSNLYLNYYKQYVKMY
jgi:hypothetical protein